MSLQSMTEVGVGAQRSYPNPIHLQDWIKRHEMELEPPIGNKLLFGPDTELQVMVVRGPNRRADFHVEAGEEWFYQLEGDMSIRLMINDELESMAIPSGHTFLLPAQIPHSPQRPPQSLGIVVERRRAADELDQMRWYCEGCSRLVHKEQFHCQELDSQLVPITNKVLSNPILNRCRTCDRNVMERTDGVAQCDKFLVWPYHHLYPMPFHLRQYISQLQSQGKPGRYRLFSYATHFQFEVAIGDMEEQRINRHEVWFLQLASKVELITNITTVSLTEGQTYLLAPNQEYIERRGSDSIGVTITI